MTEKLKKHGAVKKDAVPVEKNSGITETVVVKSDTKIAGYVVAVGCAITSRRGVLPPGAKVVVADIPGGEVVIKSLYERKLIVKK